MSVSSAGLRSTQVVRAVEVGWMLVSRHTQQPRLLRSMRAWMICESSEPPW
jgi:hypothetical protein